MIAQRIRHRDSLEAQNAQRIVVRYTPEFGELFDKELDHILLELPAGANESEIEKYCEARRISDLLVNNGEFDPI